MVGVGNGMLRATYAGYMPERSAHQVSTLTGILATAVVIWTLHRLWPIESAAQAWTIGCAWLVMTVAFEFVFGYYVAGHTLARLVADYNLMAGRVWTVFLLWITVAPWLMFRFFSD